MKIYFVASISGRSQYLENYKQIISILNNLQYKVFEDTIRPSHEEVYSLEDTEKVSFYKQVLKWINQADIVIAEASYSSLGVGHEISVALEKGKPVIVLYTEGHAPHFLEGIKSDKLIIEKYNLSNLKTTLKNALDYASDQQDTRFNFFISPRIGNYLDWLAKDRRTPRAVYLRKLIEKHMSENEEYKNF